ncbi:MAG TPA: hypothetical protein VNR64_17240 [Vicinamibacterales bacterium]|nr:hypothetical protein [Vicinamibacterales bacterium]
MRTVTLPLPVMGFVISTRAALGAGIALLLADRIPAERRRRVGLALVGLGAATTIPAVAWMSRSIRGARGKSEVETDPRLIGAARYPRKGDEVQAPHHE